MRPTREARFYALRELARRAGVTAAFFRSWRIDFREDETIVSVDAGARRSLRFLNAPPSFWDDLATGNFQTARAGWMQPPPEQVRALVPDFVVPFAHERRDDKSPLFVARDRNSVTCSLDLLASALLSLSRFEETRAVARDVHGRFPACRSLAVRDGFLNRPIVDEYGLALEQGLTYLLPGWQPRERRLRVKLSHDIDRTGLPGNPKAAVRYLGQLVRHNGLFVAARDLGAWARAQEPTHLREVRAIGQMSLERGLDSAVYWMAAPPSRWDSGYNVRHPRVLEVIAWLQDHGVEMGVHPGYYTFLSPDQLLQEVQSVRNVLGAGGVLSRAAGRAGSSAGPVPGPVGGRQHYLRWCPETWLHWERCGLAYDSTVGYADSIGFRAGTCIPYRPWLPALNREANLVEIPLLVMDRTLLGYMGLTEQQSLAAVLELLSRCRVVGGVFTLLWHNGSLTEPRYCRLYQKLLDALGGCGKYDWRSERDNCFDE